MKITIPQETAEVPDGNRCVSWKQGEESFRCQFYLERTDYISAEGAQHAGMGFGPTSITFYSCAAFRDSLRYQYGDGAYKCPACLSAQEPKP